MCPDWTFHSVFYYIETILASQWLDTDVCLPRAAAWSSSSRWRWSPWRGRMGRQHVLQLGGRHGGRVWRGLGSSSLFYALGSRNFFSQKEPLLLLSMARILSNFMSLPKGYFKDFRYCHNRAVIIFWMAIWIGLVKHRLRVWSWVECHSAH